MSSNASTNPNPETSLGPEPGDQPAPSRGDGHAALLTRTQLLQRTVALVTAAELKERAAWDAAIGDLTPAGILQVTATCTALLLVTARGTGLPATDYLPSRPGRCPDPATMLVNRQLHATADGEIADELVDAFATDHDLAGATMACCAHATWAAMQTLAAHDIAARDYLSELALVIVPASSDPE